MPHSERDQVTRLLATARQVAESLDLETVLTSIVEDATTLLGADSGDILLWDREANVLRVVAVANFEPDMLGFELPYGEGVSTQAIQAQRTIQVDAYGTYEHRARALDRYDFGAVLCAPLIFRGDAIGTINVHARADQRSFPADAADLLGAFAAHAAIAIDHARRFENEVRLGRDLATSNRDLSRSLAVQQQLAEAVLAGTGPAGIATVLAEHLDREVVIQDHLRRPIAGAEPGGGEGWRRLVEDADGSRTPSTTAIRVGAEVVGFLVLSDDELGPTDRALVDVATTGVALEFAKARAAAEVEERLRGEAVTDLLTGSYADEATIAARAARLGYDLAEPREVLVIHRTRRAEGGTRRMMTRRSSRSSANDCRLGRRAASPSRSATRWWSWPVSVVDRSVIAERLRRTSARAWKRPSAAGPSPSRSGSVALGPTTTGWPTVPRATPSTSCCASGATGWSSGPPSWVRTPSCCGSAHETTSRRSPSGRSCPSSSTTRRAGVTC